MDERKKGTMAGWVDEKEGRMAGVWVDGFLERRMDGRVDGWFTNLLPCFQSVPDKRFLGSNRYV